MNREIKFRAWHREKKMWFPIIAIGFMDGFIELMPAPDSTWTTNLADVELMQFTGLKDKNGVEIYEGDIISTKSSSNIWSFSKSVFGLKRWGRMTRDTRILCTSESEVIGNIFENKDLIVAASGACGDAELAATT